MAGAKKEDLIEKIRNLISIMRENSLTELEVHEGDTRIKIADKPVYIQVPQQSNSPQKQISVDQKVVEIEPEQTPKNTDYIKAITSPMVGMFYNAPNPEVPPYVKVGDKVAKDAVVCLVEAMKLYNDIKSGYSGKIIRQLVENKSPVEFGTELYWVDTREK